MQDKPQKKQHHHGNLREALITAGIDLLNEGGLSALTLRRCAARAGVSHAAPAYHFEGLNGLLTAIAARGYQALAETMLEERELASSTDSHARLVAICNGYLRFAQENEALFDLMFSAKELCYEDPELQQESANAHQVLHEGCAPFKHGSAGNEGTEMMIWALVHGFAGILRKCRIRPDSHLLKNIRFEDILPHLDCA